MAHTDEPTNKPATLIGGLGALLTIAGLGFVATNDFDTGTAVTVVGLAFVTVGLGTIAWGTHPGLGSQPAVGGDGQ